jgi:hypothetical protein
VGIHDLLARILTNLPHGFRLLEFCQQCDRELSSKPVPDSQYTIEDVGFWHFPRQSENPFGRILLLPRISIDEANGRYGNGWVGIVIEMSRNSDTIPLHRVDLNVIDQIECPLPYCGFYPCFGQSVLNENNSLLRDLTCDGPK